MVLYLRSLPTTILRCVSSAVQSLRLFVEQLGRAAALRTGRWSEGLTEVPRWAGALCAKALLYLCPSLPGERRTVCLHTFTSLPPFLN
jgi:hypothetical protein